MLKPLQVYELKKISPVFIKMFNYKQKQFVNE